MRASRLLSICVLLVPVFWSPSASAGTLKKAIPELSTTQISHLAQPAVVALHIPLADGLHTSGGSGVVIGKNLIVTNVHVISGGLSGLAVFHDKHQAKVLGVVGFDQEHDLALLYADTGATKPLALAPNRSLQVGDKVIAVGNPLGYAGSVNEGIVSNLVEEKGTREILTQAPIAHGSSGGALLDTHGRLVGLIRAFRLDAENINIAVPIEYLQPLLVRKRLPYDSWAVANRLLNQGATADPSVPPNDKPLNGLGPVAVTAFGLGDDLHKVGLDETTIANVVAQKLQTAGIPLAPSTGSPNDKTHALVGIGITAARDGTGHFGYSVQIFVQEDVAIVRSTVSRVRALSWNREVTSVCDAGALKSETLKVTGIAADLFIADYRTQNSSSAASMETGRPPGERAVCKP